MTKSSAEIIRQGLEITWQAFEDPGTITIAKNAYIGGVIRMMQVMRHVEKVQHEQGVDAAREEIKQVLTLISEHIDDITRDFVGLH